MKKLRVVRIVSRPFGVPMDGPYLKVTGRTQTIIQNKCKLQPSFRK